eukprot:scpid106988/ scgid26541/ 
MCPLHPHLARTLSQSTGFVSGLLRQHPGSIETMGGTAAVHVCEEKEKKEKEEKDPRSKFPPSAIGGCTCGVIISLGSKVWSHDGEDTSVSLHSFLASDTLSSPLRVAKLFFDGYLGTETILAEIPEMVPDHRRDRDGPETRSRR